MGRNNTLFTFALIDYSEEWDRESFLDEFNARLEATLNAAITYQSCSRHTQVNAMNRARNI
ncbi:hypothetical protein GCM10007425_00410 [Lysinibacillus alkalisoli]|uniref:Uncharacterized protein n=1 Tax=Lysinibacillus alkalisoli TaxID=1911548 RepID=A0A917D3G7_9BACI|nr:hypothetical protein GCM10007425_00410 [Lysinibacillus alkalisoli]